MRTLVGAAAALALSGCAGARLPSDAFQRDALLAARPEDEIDRLTSDLAMGRPLAEERLLSRLGASPSPSRNTLVRGWITLCAEHFRRLRYADGMQSCTMADELEQGSATSVVGLMAALAGKPPPSWSQPGVRIPLRDRAITVVSAGDVAIDAIVDTGAELAVVTATAARRLGAKPAGPNVHVGTTTNAVSGGMVMFEALRVGDSELRNLPAVVLADAELAPAEVEMILSLPVLVSAGRAAFLDNGATLVLGEAAPSPASPTTPLYWAQSGIGFAADFAGGRRGVHLDTGSQRTWLFPVAEEALSEAEQATKSSKVRTIGGLGGQRTEQGAEFRDVVITIAGRAWTFPAIEMAAKNDGGDAARIGLGLFKQARTVVLDFERMQMSLDE